MGTAMTDISISVVMPVRNGERWVDRALRSTLRSLPSDGEVIVVDDQSIDATIDVVKRVADRRVRLTSSGLPPGVAGALNHGLGLAEGQFIARMDADDICAPGRFDRQLALMHPRRGGVGPDLVFGSMLKFRASIPWLMPSAPVPLTPDVVPWLLLVDNVLSHPTLMCRRQTLELLGGYRITPAEDYDLWLRAAAAGLRIAREGRFEVAYRVHSGQVSGNPTWRQKVSRVPMLAESLTALAARLALPYPSAWADVRAGLDVPDEQRRANDRHIETAMPTPSRRLKLRLLASEFYPRFG